MGPSNEPELPSFRRLVVSTSLLASIGCQPSLDDEGFERPADSSSSAQEEDLGPVSKPIFSDEVPSLTPYPVIALRGTVPPNELGNQTASHVLFQGLETPLVGYAFGGNFCVEAMVEPGQYTVKAWAQDRRGELSEPTEISFAYDPSAPPDPTLRDCDGMNDLEGCIPDPAGEYCGNALDDDCDGLIDDDDPDCGRPCGHDALEPEPGDVAYISPGVVYFDLQLCEAEGEDDLFAFSLRHDESATLQHATTTPERELIVEILDSNGVLLYEAEPSPSGQLAFTTHELLGSGLSPLADYRFIARVTELSELDATFEILLNVAPADDLPPDPSGDSGSSDGSTGTSGETDTDGDETGESPQ